MKKEYTAFWFRRDLRLTDNYGLFQAIKAKKPVICFFIFDVEILNQLEFNNDARVNFIHEQLININKKLKSIGSSLIVKYGNSTNIVEKLLKDHNITNIYTNTDYEPFAVKRDQEIQKILRQKNAELKSFKDHVIFEKNEIVKKDGLPYSIYTPYMKKWRELYLAQSISEYAIDLKSENFAQLPYSEIPSLESIGFKKSSISVPNYDLSKTTLLYYNDRRNYPSMQATSLIGPHLRFGTLSIRQAVKKALKGHPQFLNELIWRDFFSQILWSFPHVEHQSFRIKYDEIKWRNNENEFKLWCEGKTGYPIVDAGMRELKQTGNMHNRIRMVVASFLCKHLLIDWRWGEVWFANHLLDYDMASNNGNWQWAAGCGCDAAPYFRIFNPYEQQKKFDSKMEYIQKWVPELNTEDYPTPMVDHKFARERALSTYKLALQ
ncbi:deoxyribodipyrimidine photolyase [Labilibaculum filiforme]|uniref:Deoxyribodipyrimidine photolyase n=1 Tax=Labilibaculum filiforme TaxID=1940526 RepID=A0A2N3HRD9_9BACT|nr:deoxyribodipyrimidine photo-lyase [Labilibaculum filiforme]PKQ60619.1 deoxyribodipyrimidine photolyase [Labilibaculum filiforme]